MCITPLGTSKPKRNHVYQSAKIQIIFDWAIIFSQFANFGKGTILTQPAAIIGEERNAGVDKFGNNLLQHFFESCQMPRCDNVGALPRSGKQLGMEMPQGKNPRHMRLTAMTCVVIEPLVGH